MVIVQKDHYCSTSKTIQEYCIVLIMAIYLGWKLRMDG